MAAGQRVRELVPADPVGSFTERLLGLAERRVTAAYEAVASTRHPRAVGAG
jgi:hypothetical protein